MDAKAVGQRIKAAREKKGLTQEELAALKYEVLKKVGDAVGNTQAFRL